MTELLPCPFCGDEAECYDSDFGNGIYCMGCGAMVGEPIHFDYRVDGRITYEQAAAAWNTRTERTCKQEERGWGTEGDHARVWLTCGHDCMVPTVQDLPHYCPNCGARVVEQ